MKDSQHITSEEQALQGTIKCFIAAVVVVFGALCLLIYGLTWMSTVEKENTAFYGAKHLEGRITALEDWRTGFVIEWARKQVEYENHIHRYYDLKIKK